MNGRLRKVSACGTLAFIILIILSGVILEAKAVDPPTFQIRGAGVSLNVFNSSATNYNSQAWDYLGDLGVNLIRCQPGIEDDMSGFSLNTTVNWATNLINFLTQANAHGIKVLFYQMGSPWGPNLLLGLVPYPVPNPRLGQEYDPWNGTEIIGTPIEEAKAMIDKLAGDNALAHNFITDSRVYGWVTSNEQNLTSSEALNWNIQLLDYIRGKGGKAWVAAPLSGSGTYWDAATYESALGGHVDMIELHNYGEWEYVNYFNYGTQSWNGYANLHEYMENYLQEMLTTSLGDNVFLGEFGCWRGIGSNEGLTNVTFSNQDRINIYSDILTAAEDAGVPNLAFHIMFSEGTLTPDYGIVKDPASGSGYWDTNLANIIRIAYHVPTSPPPPITWGNTGANSAVTTVFGLLPVFAGIAIGLMYQNGKMSVTDVLIDLIAVGILAGIVLRVWSG